MPAHQGHRLLLCYRILHYGMLVSTKKYNQLQQVTQEINYIFGNYRVSHKLCQKLAAPFFEHLLMNQAALLRAEQAMA